MIADPELYELFLECHKTFAYQRGLLVRRIRTSNKICAGDVAGYLNQNGYLCARFKNKEQRVHRIIFLMFNGYFPQQVDHINGNRTDNRIENLRAATHQQNVYNAGLLSSNKSGVKGVHWRKDAGKWRATCRVNKKMFHIGNFDNLNDAKSAVMTFREMHHGEFANHG